MNMDMMERKRIQRNNRQQERVKLLNKAFQELQELLPNSNQKKPRTKKKFFKILLTATKLVRAVHLLSR